MEYTLIRSARKTLAVEINRQGEVIVRAPKAISRRQIEAFLHQKADWIARTAEKQKETYSPPVPLAEHSTVWLLGTPRTVVFGETPCFCASHAVVRDDAPIDAQIRALFIKEANAYLKQRTALLAEQLGVAISGVKITSAKKRFGSCSSKKGICLSFRLMAAPEAFIDAVILHELCHTVHMNHGKAFYELLLRLLPDYRARHKALCEIWAPRFFDW